MDKNIGSAAAADSGMAAGSATPAFFIGSAMDELPPAHASEAEDDNDDDVAEDARESTLVMWLCGSGQTVGAYVSYELGFASLALTLTLLAAIVGASCSPGSCLLFTIPVSRWLFFLAFSVVISIPGRVADRAFFSTVAAVGQIVTFSFLLPAFFYIGAFEGSISRYVWFSLTWTLSSPLLRLQDPGTLFIFEGCMQSLLVFQLLATARNLALRVLMRTYLLGSFEGKINDVLLQNLVVLSVSREHRLDPDRCGPLLMAHDTAYRELLRTYNATNFKRKLDFIAKMRFRMYSRSGEIVPIGKKEAVVPFAKLAFKRLCRIPASALVELDTRKAEEIVGVYPPLPLTQGVASSDRLGLGGVARAPSLGGEARGVGSFDAWAAHGAPAPSSRVLGADDDDDDEEGEDGLGEGKGAPSGQGQGRASHYERMAAAGALPPSSDSSRRRRGGSGSSSGGRGGGRDRSASSSAFDTVAAAGTRALGMAKDAGRSLVQSIVGGGPSPSSSSSFAIQSQASAASRGGESGGYPGAAPSSLQTALVGGGGGGGGMPQHRTANGIELVSQLPPVPEQGRSSSSSGGGAALSPSRGPPVGPPVWEAQFNSSSPQVQFSGISPTGMYAVGAGGTSVLSRPSRALTSTTFIDTTAAYGAAAAPSPSGLGGSAPVAAAAASGPAAAASQASQSSPAPAAASSVLHPPCAATTAASAHAGSGAVESDAGPSMPVRLGSDAELDMGAAAGPAFSTTSTTTTTTSRGAVLCSSLTTSSVPGTSQDLVATAPAPLAPTPAPNAPPLDPWGVTFAPATAVPPPLREAPTSASAGGNCSASLQQQRQEGAMQLHHGERGGAPPRTVAGPGAHEAFSAVESRGVRAPHAPVHHSPLVPVHHPVPCRLEIGPQVVPAAAPPPSLHFSQLSQQQQPTSEAVTSRRPSASHPPAPRPRLHPSPVPDSPAPAVRMHPDDGVTRGSAVGGRGALEAGGALEHCDHPTEGGQGHATSGSGGSIGSADGAFHGRILATLTRLHKHGSQPHMAPRSQSPGAGGAGAGGPLSSPRRGSVHAGPGEAAAAVPPAPAGPLAMFLSPPAGGPDSGAAPHLSSISAAMGRMLREAILAGLTKGIPAEELQEVAEAAAGAFRAARPGGSSGSSGGGGGSGASLGRSHALAGDTTGAGATPKVGAPAPATAGNLSSSSSGGGDVTAGGMGGGGGRTGAGGGGDRLAPLHSTAPSAFSAAAASGGVTGDLGAGVTPHSSTTPGMTPMVSAPPHQLPPKAYPKLRLAHVASCLDPAANIDPEKAFNLFDTNADGTVERSEFIDALVAIYGDLRSLKASLNGHQSVSTAMQSLLDVLFWLILGVFVLWIFQVPVVQVYVPLGTLLVSASFAIGTALSNICSSLIFVLITRPYEVGDRITASGVFNGEETLIVKKIDVLTTTFLRVVNKELTVPNHQLLQCAIENFKRSPCAVIKIELPVSMQTTAAQLELLRRAINANLEAHPLAWKPTCIIRAGRITEASICLTLWLSSHYLWQDAPRLFRANYLFHAVLLTILRDLGIQFRAPDQSVSLLGAPFDARQHKQLHQHGY